MKKVGIIMGSDSDLPIVKKATDMLSTLDVPFEVHVYSAHRTPVEASDFAKNARANGFGAIIAAAGMAAHLAGAIAANTTLPVIGTRRTRRCWRRRSSPWRTLSLPQSSIKSVRLTRQSF